MKVEGGKETLGLRRVFSDPAAVVFSGFPKASSPQNPSWLGSYCRFFIAGLTRHSQTGALVPSQRFLIDQMIAPIPAGYNGQVVELGTGTGVLTMRLAERRPECRVVSYEINPLLANEVQMRVAANGLAHRVKIACCGAEAILQELSAFPVQNRADFILSGIPLGNLPKNAARDLIQQIWGALKPGGMYIQFQHSLLDRQKIKTRFSSLRTVPVLLNFPPAFVYYAWK